VFPVALLAQVVVDQTPGNRTVLLEQYAGINCGNCPAAHALAGDLLAQYPGALVTVELHGGGTADPLAGQPDFRSAWSDSLWAAYNPLGQPKAGINRTAIGPYYVASTSGWPGLVAAQFQVLAPVNLGLATTFDPATRVLTVDVGLYYTANSPGGADRIAVLLTESDIIGYQQDYVNGPQQNYAHQHILRACLTDLWGDEVTTTMAGTSVSRTYSFIVPQSINVANSEVIAFVSEYQGEVYQAKGAGASGTSTTGIDDAAQGVRFAPAYPLPADAVVHVPVEGIPVGTELQLIDATGRTVARQRTEASAVLAFNVADLPAGTYVCIAPALGVHSARRVVVLH